MHLLVESKYLNFRQYPLEYFLYLYIFLALWDPWHFLRQHFGFMRIYDRHNRAPAALASNMDWSISAIWFLHIMLASADWLPTLLADMYRNTGFGVITALSAATLAKLQLTTWWLAVVMTLVYTGYLLWCVGRGFYVSVAKLGLLICTFGVMYFTYTPNEWILQLVPAWSFKVGFAALGIVHMTQYLAIVWRYDRSIAQQGRARANWFGWWHSRRASTAVVLAAAGYVMLCLLYGATVTASFDNRWLMSCLLAVGFTSTLMHYYFDGFMWRLRHHHNRTALDGPISSEIDGLGGEVPPATTNGPDLPARALAREAKPASAVATLARQLLYFVVPMAILTAGAAKVWQADGINYVQYMYRAQTLSQQGDAAAAAVAAESAYASMQRELPFAEKIAELKPTAAHSAQLAFLIYNHSLYQHTVLPALAGRDPTPEQLRAHLHNVRRAAAWLSGALAQGGDLAHPGREQFDRSQAQQIVYSWHHQAQTQY